MFVLPQACIMLMTALLMRLKASAAVPVRMRQRSSSSVTSRTQKVRFSIAQRPRSQRSRSAVFARLRSTLVMA